MAAKRASEPRTKREKTAMVTTVRLIETLRSNAGLEGSCDHSRGVCRPFILVSPRFILSIFGCKNCTKSPKSYLAPRSQILV